MDSAPRWLSQLVRWAETRPDAPALVTGVGELSYAQLLESARRVAAALEELVGQGEDLVGVFGGRSNETYVSVLGILLGGRGYVPLNPRFPAARCARMIERSQARTLVISGTQTRRAGELLDALGAPLRVLVVGGQPDEWRDSARRHRVVHLEDITPDSALAPDRAAPDDTDIAYLMFTSGSTGDPKGIAVTHANVAAYLEALDERLDVGEGARFSQTFDLTFDLSVHDLFVCWMKGACLHVPQAGELMAPAKFIREREITHWFSVPSVVSSMIALRMLREDIFPSLVSSLFCGEALHSAHAEAWQRAAPNSLIENLYGPTEATIAITGYRWDPARSPGECRSGVVPIGEAFPGQHALVVSDDGAEMPPGEAGELVLGGSQVTPGYWGDETRSAKSFVSLPGREGTWYRTGDEAVLDAQGRLHFLGRRDDQVKIRGFRVELQEIDETLRKHLPGAEAVTIAWPRKQGTAEGVAAFLLGADDADLTALKNACRQDLPDYMVPRRFVHVDSWPLNANGKIDRKALALLLEGKARSAASPGGRPS